MVQAIREHVTVETEGSIEIRHPELQPGSRAEVIVLLEPGRSRSADPSEGVLHEPIWKAAEQVSKALSPEEWAAVPRDLSKNLDHYLYGSPRDEE